MQIKEIRQNIYLLTFPNQFEMTFTFFRMQEYYESPLKELNGKYFTLEKAIEKYAYLKLKDKKEETFSYLTDWNGFNIPGEVFLNFYTLFLKKNDLLKREQVLFNLVHPLIKKLKDKKKFYIIGSLEDNEEVIKHEVAHGFYSLNAEYKRKMNEIISDTHPMVKEAKEHLLAIGYSEAVLDDEIQAYFSTGIKKKMISKGNLKRSYLNKFRKVFEDYYGK